jgi:molybdopterin-guanine dinucleotide biosynthesis protein A
MRRFDGIAGIFVGGKGVRLGGLAKGLLHVPGDTSTLVERLTRKLEAVGVETIVLVGDRPDYADLHVPSIPDSGIDLGPMAGLMSLVRHAMNLGRTYALAIACDMPYVESPLLHTLCHAAPEAFALVPKRALLEPLCARYLAAAVEPLIAHKLSVPQLSITAMLRELGDDCVMIPIAGELASSLDDWDEPADLPETLRNQLGFASSQRE